MAWKARKTGTRKISPGERTISFLRPTKPSGEPDRRHRRRHRRARTADKAFVLVVLTRARARNRRHMVTWSMNSYNIKQNNSSSKIVVNKVEKGMPTRCLSRNKTNSEMGRKIARSSLSLLRLPTEKKRPKNRRKKYTGYWYRRQQRQPGPACSAVFFVGHRKWKSNMFND